MNINRIIISGNLVANPTLRETSSGTPVASATIANNEFFNDADGQRQQSEDGQKHFKHFLKAENWQFTQSKAKESVQADVAPTPKK